jgi:hypothetical protein
MAKLYLKRTLNGFTPDDAASVELARKYKVGDVYAADVRKERSGKMHRRYWKLLSVVLENSDQFQDIETLHDYLKLRTGHCTPIANKVTGEVFLIPKSISFSAMDQTAFEDFFRRVTTVICEDVIPGLDADDLVHEVEKLLGLAA